MLLLFCFWEGLWLVVITAFVLLELWSQQCLALRDALPVLVIPALPSLTLFLLFLLFHSLMPNFAVLP